MRPRTHPADTLRALFYDHGTLPFEGKRHVRALKLRSRYLPFNLIKNATS